MSAARPAEPRPCQVRQPRHAGAACLATISVGCGGSDPLTAEQQIRRTAQQLIKADQQGDYATICSRLLTRSARQRFAEDYSSCEEGLEEGGETVFPDAIIDAVARTAASKAQVTTRGSHEEQPIGLRQEGGAWKVDFY